MDIRQFGRKKLARSRLTVVRGTPDRRINDIVEAERADMAIVGSRGQSPLENRVIGSTARDLARTTVVALLVTRVEVRRGDPAAGKSISFRRPEPPERGVDDVSTYKRVQSAPAAAGSTLLVRLRHQP